MFLKNKIRAVTYGSIKKTQKNSEKISHRFREKFPGNFLPKFPEISWIFSFLKDKIKAVTCVTSPENAGKSGGKFPGIFPEKIFRHFPEFPEISKFPKFPEISRENLARRLLLYNNKKQF